MEDMVLRVGQVGQGLRYVGRDRLSHSLLFALSDLDWWWDQEGVAIWLRVGTKAALSYIAATPQLPLLYRDEAVLKRLISGSNGMRYLEKADESPL